MRSRSSTNRDATWSLDMLPVGFHTRATLSADIAGTPSVGLFNSSLLHGLGWWWTGVSCLRCRFQIQQPTAKQN
jgi:hypothetical protein